MDFSNQGDLQDSLQRIRYIMYPGEKRFFLGFIPEYKGAPIINVKAIVEGGWNWMKHVERDSAPAFSFFLKTGIEIKPKKLPFSVAGSIYFGHLDSDDRIQQMFIQHFEMHRSWYYYGSFSISTFTKKDIYLSGTYSNLFGDKYYNDKFRTNDKLLYVTVSQKLGIF
jgi:hypothetical protein